MDLVRVRMVRVKSSKVRVGRVRVGSGSGMVSGQVIGVPLKLIHVNNN